LPKNTIKFAETFLSKNNIRKDDLLIGINTGAGKVFANKYLKPVQLSRLTELLQRKLKARILLLGGPQEEKVHKYLKEKSNGRLIDSGCNNSLLDFAALIDRCTFVITADTMALHMAVALGKPVVALFGPTCHQEIDLYGKGRKIVTDKKCAPCYKNKCIKPNNCMDSIKLGRVIEAARELVF
jgi:heptosyltransferase-2